MFWEEINYFYEGLDTLECIVNTKHMQEFGAYIRERREQLLASDRSYTLRKVAQRVGIKPVYLSRIERDDLAPPAEEVVRKLAAELGLHADVLLAMAGKVSKELREIIMQRPELIGELLREIQKMPNHAVLRIVREVRDGEW